MTEILSMSELPTETIAIAVQRGWQVLVVAHLHLHPVSDEHSEALTSTLARRLESWVGPGVVVFAGDTFELYDEPNNSPQRSLNAHPRLAAGMRRFAEGPDRRLVVLAGEHDARLIDDAVLRAELEAVGAEVGLRGELTIDTGAGFEHVRVESCAGTPQRDVSFDVEVAASKRFYATLRRLWWLPVVVPVVGFLATMLAVRSLSGGAGHIHHMSLLRWVYFGCSIVSVQLILVVLAITSLASRHLVHDAVVHDPNRIGRAIAADLSSLDIDGYIGIGSSTPELSDLGGRWYANPGSVERHLTRRRTRFGFPPVFAPSNELSWVELEAGARLHVSLTAARRDDRPTWWLERVASISRLEIAPTPTTVVHLAPGVVWPIPDDPLRRVHRIRRRGALAVAAVGVVDILSAVTPPWRIRLSVVRSIIPIDVDTPALVAGGVAAMGVGLVMLAAGLRRGRQLAWQLCLTTLVVSTLGHVAKGFDLEEATLSGILAVWMARHRDAFSAPSGGGALRKAALIAFGAVTTAVLAAATWIWAATDQTFVRSAAIAIARTVAIPADHLPRHQYLLASALPSIAIAAVLTVGWYAVRARRAPSDDPTTMARAWAIVHEHGSGTLDYFALRDDKAHFICEDTLVAYTVVNGTAVVSPDPVGPPDQRSRVWSAFRRFAAENGWRTIALGAGAAWLPVYRATGMWAMYIGDESVVDVQRFSLEGGRHKSLRQAVNRVAKAGYTVEFHDPADLDQALRNELLELATQSRRGPTERGFSMTLSRLFDPRDRGLLLALARDAEGGAAAFCQFVPAKGIDGYSLDVMRRGDAARQATNAHDEPRPRHPNGLTEYVVVRTIEHLRAQGYSGLGLHFATMRALLAGETGSRIWHRALAELMHRMSDDMQIESLWKFNAKFDPTWLPRYVVFDRPESTLLAGLAIARVESLWELPLIGRLIRPNVDSLTPSSD